MAIIGEIEHIATYRYAKPVSFGTHRAMFLPLRGASARLLGWSAKTNIPSRVHWVSDARSNMLTVMEITRPGEELTFRFQVRKSEHFTIWYDNQGGAIPGRAAGAGTGRRDSDR